MIQPKESKSNSHFNISLLKSCVRIIAGVTLIKGEISISGILFIIAELLGIAEEII